MQRHAVLIDKENAAEWTPLLYLGEGQAQVLGLRLACCREFAAMGFEYGYSVERPDALVLWEAQFGDFVNGAQTIIDEFISSSEQKWGQRSSVVLLLPHGYEGQGPDHSSARIERFLQMCAENNMTVAYPSTPASYFHLLRRQAYARPRRPLIVFTPKSMLRLQGREQRRPRTSPPARFRPVMPDLGTRPGEVTRVLIAAGKVDYDLLAERDKRGDTATALVRLEQYYPLPAAELAKRARRSTRTPRSSGCRTSRRTRAPGRSSRSTCPRRWPTRASTGRCASSRAPASASPATGSTKKHQAEQADLVAQAFDR